MYFRRNKCTITITIFTRPCDVIKDTHQHKNCFDEQELMLLLSLKLFDNDSPFKKIRGHNFNNASTRSIRTIYTTYLPDLECHSFLNAFLYLHQAKYKDAHPNGNITSAYQNKRWFFLTIIEFSCINCFSNYCQNVYFFDLITN